MVHCANFIDHCSLFLCLTAVSIIPIVQCCIVHCCCFVYTALLSVNKSMSNFKILSIIINISFLNHYYTILLVIKNFMEF